MVSVPETPTGSWYQLQETDIISLLLAFNMRQGLSKVALGDLLELLRVLGVTKKVPVSKYKLLKNILDVVGDQHAKHFLLYVLRRLS